MRGIFKPSNIGFLFGVLFAVSLLKAQKGRELNEKDHPRFPSVHQTAGEEQKRATLSVKESGDSEKTASVEQVILSEDQFQQNKDQFIRSLASLDARYPSSDLTKNLSSDEAHDTPTALVSFVSELSKMIESSENDNHMRALMKAHLEGCSKRSETVMSVRAFCLSEWARLERVDQDRFSEWVEGHGFKGRIVRLAKLAQ